VLLKALQAEGIRIGSGKYDEQHRYQLYSEAKWWRHPVVISRDLHGATQVNKQAVRLPVFHDEASELIEQYVQAFEKVAGSAERRGGSTDSLVANRFAVPKQ
jgi:hypothetical protein